MTRPEKITTYDIELAAALMTATQKRPVCIFPGPELVEFTFPANDISESVIMKYAACTLLQDVRRLAKNRSWLYRQCRDVARSGVGVTYEN